MANHTCLLCLALLFSPVAIAQTALPAVDPAMCDQLAAMPQAPMTAESCRKLLGVAVDDPKTHRPGDEAMSCAQIFAELETRNPAGVSPEEAARHEALIEQGATMNERHAKMNAIESAPESAALRTAALLPPPLGAPIAAKAMASLEKKGVVASKRYMTEVHQVTGGSADIVEKFGSDPRRVRLGQLAANRQCKGPGG
ncbi:MAG: hypothetical protein ABI538_02850 [Pseudoxanthomonas sp.]